MAHCDETLKKIGRIIFDYQKNNEGKNPPDLQTLVDLDILSPWDLVCPASSFGVGQCSYEYRGADLYSGLPKDLILAYDKQPGHKGRRNILFANGDVSRPPEKIFHKHLSQDNKLRQKLSLPEIDIYTCPT